MTLATVAIPTLAMLAVGYLVYSRILARLFALDPRAVTPAHRFADGIDYVAIKPTYLFGQHLSAIAAAGPIAGPILASQQFGWLPCILWITFGVVFIGAVHDFSSLVLSVRHRGGSIAQVVRETLGDRAGLAITAFIWLALAYVIVAFADITAGTFTTGGEDLVGGEFDFHPGGAVAAASLLYLVLALVMGAVQRWLRPPLWLSTAIFVPATLVAVWAGTELSTWILLDARTWMLLILAYCVVASLVPVSVLLQPRGYLGGFVLYLALAAGVIGIFFGDFPIQQEAFTSFHAGGATGAMFPFLFVTIACGACSGFHGLVCSGTTSKQVDNESHCRPIGYGAMLMEAFIALIALATIMIMAPADVTGLAPGVIYGDGLGRFLTVVIGEEHFRLAATFGAMAFSTFVFDTLDVSTRLGRYIIQEVTGWKGAFGPLAAALLTVAPAAVFAYGAESGDYRVFWLLFGSSNQLLAGLTLMIVSVWLLRERRRTWLTVVPMVFILAITVTALVLQMVSSAAEAVAALPEVSVVGLNAIFSAALLALAAYLLVRSLADMRASAAGRPRN